MGKVNIIYKKINELLPYINNPRNHTDVDKIASSIKNFGFKQPIVIDSKNEIIDGQHGEHLQILKNMICGIIFELVDVVMILQKL